MVITLRGRPVRSKLVSRSLSQKETDAYRPSWLGMPIKIIFGFNNDMLDDYGIMLYHKNRLIKAYEKVGYQKQENELGVGVVGVAEVDFLEPIHNKQDFKADEKYSSVMKGFGEKLNDYWNEKTQGHRSQTPKKTSDVPGLWAQCNKCLKWRRLPGLSTEKSLPDKWFCFLNRDVTHNHCEIPEEKETDNEEVVKPSYEKTFKRKQREQKQREKQKLQDILQQVSQSSLQKSKANSLRLQRSSLKTSTEQTRASLPTENQPADTSHLDDNDDDLQPTPLKRPHLEQNEKLSRYEANSLQLAPSFLKKKQDRVRNTEEDVASPTSSDQRENYNTELEQNKAQEVGATNDNESESGRETEDMNGTETYLVGSSQSENISSSNDAHMEEHLSSTYKMVKDDLTRRNRETYESMAKQRTTQKVKNDKDGNVKIKLEIPDDTTCSPCHSYPTCSGPELMEIMREKLKKKEKDLEDIKEKLGSFRSNVKNLLGLIAPDDNLKEVNDIETLVEELIKKYQEPAKKEDDWTEDKKEVKPANDFKHSLVEFQGSSPNKTKPKVSDKQCCLS